MKNTYFAQKKVQKRRINSLFYTLIKLLIHAHAY